MNDFKASELISQSLMGVLSEQESRELTQHLAENPDSQSFATLSALIQGAVSEMSQFPNETDGNESQASECLSSIAKERLRRAIREAQHRSLSEEYSSQALLVAQSETTYFTGPTPEPLEENRQTIANFTLLRKIGEGGLGTVWLARDERLKRNVAIKELNSSASESKKLWQRFAREAEITGHLEHPNVVPLYLSGVNAETGVPFYAMRFLGKQTLADAIVEYHARRADAADAADDPIHLHRLLNAFLDVCQAIAFAHARGVIHRDLKPENVALDNFGQVLVLDWGLAKIDSDGELATRLALSGVAENPSVAQTLEGDVVGTPLYMSPEQALGDMNQLDQRTDVYGLGAILFAILTGSAPHENSHRTESGNLGMKEVLQSIAHSETPNPRHINPSVPRDLQAICMRAMANQRFARYASAEELAREVERWIAGRNQLQSNYDSLRLTGRDLKSRLCVQIRQLIGTAQFMVELPPIQGLITSLSGEPSRFADWRERLWTILLALARTKPNISALSYSQITDNRINEFVRIERSLHDVANVRSLPQSRLRHGAANTFHKVIMEQFPGECCLGFDMTVSGLVRIVAGVPVFDVQTEEPFGLVLAEAEMGSLVRPEIEGIETKDEIYLIDDKGRVLFSSQPHKSAVLNAAEDEIARWPEIAKAMANSPEFVDADHEYYATRLEFPQKNNSLIIVLKNSR